MEPRGRPVRAECVTVVGNGVVVVGGRAARQRMAADGTDVVPVAVRGVTAAEEFIAFVTAAKDPLYRMAFLLCGDHHRAEELTQRRSRRPGGRGAPHARAIRWRTRGASWRTSGSTRGAGPAGRSSPDSTMTTGAGSPTMPTRSATVRRW